MRAFKWTYGDTVKVKRNGTGKLGCCCAITLTIAGFTPPSCYLYAPAGSNVIWSSVAINGIYATTGSGPWTAVDVEDIAASGTLYSDPGCTASDGPITGFVAAVTISKAGSTYTVSGTNGGFTVISATGAANTPLTNTAGGGTVTVNT